MELSEMFHSDVEKQNNFGVAGIAHYHLTKALEIQIPLAVLSSTNQARLSQRLSLGRTRVAVSRTAVM
jgi:hypothetical protein